MMRKISKYLFFWALGGALYYTFEILFRGFSHWSMYVLGGICFVFFYIQGESMGWQEPVWKQTLRCTVFVTAGEFITGIIVNKWLHYSLGLQPDAVTGIWTDLCTFYDYFFRSKCTWNFSQWLSCILSLQRSQTIVSYSIT